MNLLKKSRLSKVFLAVLLVMVLAFSLTASAVTGVNQIGSSPSQLDATAAGMANYGYDPALPVILAFDVAVNASNVLISDITFNDVDNAVPVLFTLLFSTDTAAIVGQVGLQANEVIVLPSTTLLADNLYTLQYAGQTEIEFKTKAPGGGGGGGRQTPRLCVGRIVDSTDFANVGDGTLLVPLDQLFRYAFTNNIPATTTDNTDPNNIITHNNADSINMFKWIGADTAPTRDSILASSNPDDLDADPDTLTPAFFSDPDNWQPVAIVDTFSNGPNMALRQLVSINPVDNLDEDSFYAILIDQTLESQGNTANPPLNLQKAVFEFFKTGTVEIVVDPII